VKLAAALVLISATAHAGPPIAAPPPSPPDPAATEQAADANFDEDAPHHGFIIAFSIGPADQLGFGTITHASGAGFGASFRLGAQATRRIGLLFAIDSTNYVEQIDNNPSGINTSQVFSLGPRVTIRDALWLRAGVGAASFQRRATSGSTPERVFTGPGGTVAAGIDVVRRGRFALSVELTLIGSIYREGFVGGGFMGLGVAYD